MFTFQVVVNGFNLPLIYCLLPNKTTETYKKMFDLIAGHVDVKSIKTRLIWRCDFELAIWRGIEGSPYGKKI